MLITLTKISFFRDSFINFEEINHLAMKRLALAVLLFVSILPLPSCKKSDTKKESSVKLMSELIQERDARLKEGLQADEIIGSWKFRQYQISGTLTIYKKENQYYCYGSYFDGSKGNELLSKEGNDKYYVIRDGQRSTSGDYYLVTSDGILTVCDDNGDIGWKTEIPLYPSI